MQARHLRTTRLLLIAVLAAVLAGGLAVTAAGAQTVRGDFNGDGYGDLAIGVPNEPVQHIHGAGAVNVLYGSPFFGLAADGNQIWHQNSPLVGERSEEDDHFGAALAVGDFNGDGYGDLAIGVPNENNSRGAVNVLYGTVDGLAATDSQLWNQDTALVLDDSELGDLFGASLASGDFNGDGYDDLAIGVPGEGFGPFEELIAAGAVNVLYGTETGLTAIDNQIWHQDDVLGILGDAEAGDAFGFALTTGDFNGDGFDDLAVGAPGEDIRGAILAGAVNVIFGSWPSLRAEGNQFWHQDSRDRFGALRGRAQDDDRFGSALAAGDFDGDGYSDLAVGVPGENLGITISQVGIENAGLVNVIRGAHEGLHTKGNQIWHQDQQRIPERAEPHDAFGASLTAADYDGDGFSDLAVGVPGDSSEEFMGAGAVNVIYGSEELGLASFDAQLWRQSSPGIRERVGNWEQFGTAVASGDFNGDGYSDLAVGVFNEEVGVDLRGAGAVNVIYGAPGFGLTPGGNQLWHQDVRDVRGRSGLFDEFGYALGAQ